MISRLRVYYLYTSFPCILIIAGVMFYFNEIKGTVVNNPHPQILYAIFTVIIVAVISILFAMRRLSVEAIRIKKFFEAAGNQADSAALMALAGKGDTAYLLRMIAMSAGRAISSHEYSSMQNELKKVSSRLTSGNALPQFISGLLVGMGLLGTFVGLLATLKDLSVLIGGLANTDINASAIAVFGKMVEQLKAPMQSMGIAFSASLYGLVGSIITSLMMLPLRRFQTDIYSYLSSELAQHSETSFGRVSPKLASAEVGGQSTAPGIAPAPTADVFTRILLQPQPGGREEARRIAPESAVSAEAIDTEAVPTAVHKASPPMSGDTRSVLPVTAPFAVSGNSGSMLANLTEEEGKILNRIEERLAETVRAHKRILSSETDAFQKQRAEMMRTLAEQTEASNNFRNELQKVGTHLIDIISVAEKGNHEISAQVTELLVQITADGRETQKLLRLLLQEQSVTNALLGRQ